MKRNTRGGTRSVKAERRDDVKKLIMKNATKHLKSGEFFAECPMAWQIRDEHGLIMAIQKRYILDIERIQL